MDVTLEQIDATEIARLRKGLQTVQETYFWYQLEDHSLPDNILQQGILPNGGLAHAFVRALEERVGGLKWQECEAELKQTNIRERVVINQFQC